VLLSELQQRSWELAVTVWSILWLGFCLGLELASTAGAQEVLTRFERTEPHMGTQVHIVAYASSETAWQQAADAAFRRFAELDARFSDYRSDSELMQLCASAPHEQPVSVSEELFDVLRIAARISEASEGAFDVTVGNVTRLWRRARRQHTAPSKDLLEAALATVDYKQIRLFEANHAVQLTRKGVRIDLGGIAKGFACDKALQELQRQGITRALIHAGGDMVLGEPPPDADGWPIAVAGLRRDDPPVEFFSAARCAVATSGDLWQFLEIEGRRYSHIIDPRTGWGIEGPRSVTVVARDGATADALATAISVLGPERGLNLAKQFQASVLIRMLVQDQVQSYRSCDFPQLAGSR
jgi:thiamine biosynthesis lipoprotein